LPDSTNMTGRGHQRRLIWGLAATVFIGAVIGVVLTSPRKTPDRLVWMTPGKLAQTLRPGKLTLLKFRILRWPGPWRWYVARKRTLKIESQLYTTPNESPLRIEHFTLCSTNAEGLRAWIIPPEEMLALAIECKMSPGVQALGGAAVTTFEGGQARVSSGSNPAGVNGFCGIMLDILPEIERGSIKLLLGVTATDWIASPSGTTVGVETNISASCRAMIPNGGALLLQGANRGSGTNHWMVISAMAIDAKGNPLKLEP